MSPKNKTLGSPANAIIEYVLNSEPDLRRSVQRQVGADNVDDVFQDVYTRVLGNEEKVSSIRDPRAYARWVLMNVVQDFSLRQRRVSKLIRRHQLEDDPRLLTSAGESAEQQLVAEQEVEFFLRHLTPMAGAALLLSLRDGLSNTEIAIRLGVSERTIAVTLSRARRMIHARYGPPPDNKGKLLYEAKTELTIPDRTIITDVVPRIEIASARLAERLKNQPQDIHGLTSREFEYLIAELLTDLGCGRVQVTPATRDGGRDLLAYFDLDLGTLLCLVEAKKNRPDRPVGVELVRSLYGVVCHEDASHGMLVTTSTFTSDAQAFQLKHPHRLSLRDYTHLTDWIHRYGRRRH